MTNAQTKVVFGGLSPEDARIMAELIFMGEHDLQQAKERYDKPTVVRYATRWFKSYTTGESLSRSEQWSDGDSETSGFIDTDADEPRKTETVSTSRQRTEGSSRSVSASAGQQEGLTPILETRPSQGYSLEEQIYKAMALMINQPTQRAIVKLPSQRSRRIRTPDVEDGYANAERVEQFKHEAFSATPFASPLGQAQEEIDLRRQELESQAKAHLARDAPASFRE